MIRKGKQGAAKKAGRKRGIYEMCIKRPLDFVSALIALIVFSPVMLTVAVLVRMKLGKPIIFVQERPGKNEKIFKMYKFRSMSNARGKDGELLPDAGRLGGFGKALRAASLDELPELFNILKGDMSVVGPRPLVPQYLSYYTEKERHRHDVRPGLTGLAQINGRNSTTWEERFRYDIEYIENITFKNDILILLKTVVTTVKRENIGIRGVDSLLDFDLYRKKQTNRKDNYEFDRG